MTRDIIISMSEFLFWVTDGIPIINTIWIIFWIIIGVLFITLPLFWVIFYSNNNEIYRKYSAVIFIFTFIFMSLSLVLTIGAPIAQQQMLQECRNTEAIVEIENKESFQLTLRECRVKENYYGEFGNWKIVK